MLEDQVFPANTKTEYYITQEDLPISCPTKEMVLWNSHPRVYLAFENNTTETCPYCGAKFMLKEQKK